MQAALFFAERCDPLSPEAEALAYLGAYRSGATTSGQHWIHLRTAKPIESTFAAVRLRQRVTKGPGSRAVGIAMASNPSSRHSAAGVPSIPPTLIALVRAGAKFENGVLVERPDEATSGDTHAA
jgi:putative transposase